MSLDVKICGLNDAASVDAAVAGGARYAGFVFYPKSPRAVAVEQASALVARLPASIFSVGLFVDADDDEIRYVATSAKLTMIQLHGQETPQRVAAVKSLTGLPVIKAIGIATVADVETALRYPTVADILLLDSKPSAQTLPGGNATAFDWTLLSGVAFARPWMLAGGLKADTLARAISVTRATLVDVSSGVEDAPGRKNPLKIKEFMQKARAAETCY